MKKKKCVGKENQSEGLKINGLRIYDGTMPFSRDISLDVGRSFLNEFSV